MSSRSFEPSPPEPSRHQRKAWGARLRMLGVVRHAPMVVLLAVAVMVVAVGAAAAEPIAADAGLVARAKRLQAKLDGQHAAVERLTERLNATQERRDQLQRSLDGLRTRQQTVAAELAAAQQQLDEQARAIYMQGPEWLLGELLGGVGAPGVPGRLPLQRAAALQAQAGVVSEVRVRKAELDGISERLATELGEADLVYDRYITDRQQLQALVEQVQATLKQLDGRLAGWLEAEEARAEAARRAAWAGYMAGVGSVQSWLRAGPAARAAVRWALGQLGDPYRWGAEGPDAFDCSGLTSSAYLAAGNLIPRTSLLQWGAGPHPDVPALLPGDLLFYGDDPHNPATIHHVGLYIGNGLMVHAPQTGDVVRIASVWRAGYVGATRVVPGVPKPGAPPTLPLGPPTTVAPPVPPPMTIAPTTTRPTSTRPPTTTAPPTATVPPGTTSPTTTTEATTTAPPTTTPAPTTTEAPTTTAPPTTTEAPTTTDPPPTS